MPPYLPLALLGAYPLYAWLQKRYLQHLSHSSKEALHKVQRRTKSLRLLSFMPMLALLFFDWEKTPVEVILPLALATLVLGYFLHRKLGREYLASSVPQQDWQPYRRLEFLGFVGQVVIFTCLCLALQESKRELLKQTTDWNADGAKEIRQRAKEQLRKATAQAETSTAPAQAKR